MIDLLKNVNCNGCHACYSVCPNSAITMVSDNQGFLYPKINHSLCIECGLCEKVCYNSNGNKLKTNFVSRSYAAFSKDNELRCSSSSGGIFSLLALEILGKNGAVIGAAFDDDFKKVKHTTVTSVDSLYKLRGAKYIQSEVGDTYKEAKNLLNAGKPVLFSGTPCQISGLKAFLGKEYENLFLVDIICHGVPSPKIWQKYLEIYQTKFAANPEKVAFRNKKYGWGNYSFYIKFSNDKEHIKAAKEDMYMRGYLNNLYLRPSCYECSHKGIKSSDITLGDFWGIDNVISNMNDNQGTSLVIINSKKGQGLFDSISEKVKSRSCDLNKSIKNNQSILKSAAFPVKSMDFWNNIENLKSEKVFKKYCKVPLVEKNEKDYKKVFESLTKENKNEDSSSGNRICRFIYGCAFGTKQYCYCG